MEQVAGVEPAQSGRKHDILAVKLYLHELVVQLL